MSAPHEPSPPPSPPGDRHAPDVVGRPPVPASRPGPLDRAGEAVVERSRAVEAAVRLGWRWARAQSSSLWGVVAALAVLLLFLFLAGLLAE
ncbi:hypothetical protein [uncultured Nocardioides sp.]|uniref:hypothetical protein n=1 Tax=uncultured Nocardioides sp. TaxID=198441 RepID=UPI0025D33FF0|nr:hypothetical protein [uncultured Nocardioides sp.]